MKHLYQHSQVAWCQGFVELVEGEFSFLFKDGGFSIVKQDEARGGEICLVILASKDYQLKFIADRSRLEAMIGSADAVRSWENIIAGQIEWYGLRNFIEAVKGVPHRSAEELRQLGNRLFNTSLEAHLAELSRMLAPVHGDIQAVFRDGRYTALRKDL